MIGANTDDTALWGGDAAQSALEFASFWLAAHRDGRNSSPCAQHNNPARRL
jgi:hypothetical protein